MSLFRWELRFFRTLLVVNACTLAAAAEPLPLRLDTIDAVNTSNIAPVHNYDYSNYPATDTLPLDASPDLLLAPPQLAASGWHWQHLPEDLIYGSYLAGVHEPRMGAVFFHDEEKGGLWDSALGGRIGLVRYGDNSGGMPQGWQWDVEAAAFPRLQLEEENDLASVDFRAGTALTWGWDSFQAKAAFYHLSSHLGDEFLLKNPTFTRVNYVRDALVLGGSWFLADCWRIYAEVGWGFHFKRPAEPWEFQFGLDYSPLHPRGHGPFFAVNAHLREEVNFGGSLAVQAGWKWQELPRGPILRIGLHYLNGESSQFQFWDDFEQQVGAGVWYDY